MAATITDLFETSKIVWDNTNDPCILLIYKDPPRESLEPGLKSSSRSSIDLHLDLAEATPDWDLFSPTGEAAQKKLFDPLSAKRFVWGWWRKPWERHDALLTAVRNVCDSGKAVKAILYNQYSNTSANAAIHSVYFRPGLTSIPVPYAWRHRCPAYYREARYLCGAYFIMNLLGSAKTGDASEVLKSFFIDAASFEHLEQTYPRDLQPPLHVRNVVRPHLFSQASKQDIRASEHTLFLLNSESQAGSAVKRLSNHVSAISNTADNGIANTFSRGTWTDALPSLKQVDTQGWKMLARLPNTISALGRLARLASSRTTRFDLELVALAHLNEGLKPVLFEGSPSLAESLRNWVLTESEVDARVAAGKVFSVAWEIASKRYKLAPQSTYLRNLPGIETIISAVKFEFGGKFYRDHLSHNVRAALLAAELHSRIRSSQPTLELDGDRVCFFGGLFHDISLPIVSFPELASGLAKAMRGAPLVEEGTYVVNPLFNAEAFSNALYYACVLASISYDKRRPRVDAAHLWNDPAQTFEKADPAVLREVLLCAQNGKHAIASAALLFQAAVMGRGGGKFTANAVNDLFSDLFSSNDTQAVQELHGIIQSAALHDRREAGNRRGMNEIPSETPISLDWDKYLCPLIVSVADECQEWGRPLADIQSMGAIDATVSLTSESVDATFQLADETQTFSRVPFSPLESLLGKFQTLRSLRGNLPPTGRSDARISLSLNDLKVFYLWHVRDNFRLSFAGDTTHVPYNTGRRIKGPHLIVGNPDTDLFAIGVGDEVSPTDRIARDFLVISGSARATLRNLLGQTATRLSSISVSDTGLNLSLDGGEATIRGSLSSYAFGELNRSDCYPSQAFLKGEGAVAVASFAVSEVTVQPASVASIVDLARTISREHFLDYDWRFTTASCELLIDCLSTFEDTRKIAYLGCPILAITHALQRPKSKLQFLLIDKGHPDITEWISMGLLTAAQFLQCEITAENAPPHTGTFDAVIADPPWYAEDYSVFAKWARSLVRRGGVVGITNLPTGGPYKDTKRQQLRRAQDATFGAALRDESYVGSADVSYVAPAFETSWGGDRPFVDHDLDRYRPAKVDFFRVFDVRPHWKSPNPQTRTKRILPSVLPLKDGHYVRAVEALPGTPTFVKLYTYRKLSKINDVGSSILAWSTKNTVVEMEQGGAPIRDHAELARLVELYESKT